MHQIPSTSPDPNLHRLLQLAGRQFGAFTTEQARAKGVSRGQLRHLVGMGVVRRRRRGLYVVAGAPDSHQRRAMESVLAAPAGAATSHLTAAHLIAGRLPPPLVHLTVKKDERVRLDGVVAHRSVLPASHVAMIGPLPVTTISRTIVDLASLGDLELLTDVLDPALVDGRTNPARILRTIDEIVERPGRHGTRLLRSALEAWTDPIRPGSPAEVRLLRRLRELGHGGYVTQFEVRVGDRRRFVDVAWPDDHVGLEYTGRVPHNPRRWAADEVRGEELAALGWRLREVDSPDLLPGERGLFDWLETQRRNAA